jgi:hypothetical protein
VVAGAVTHLWLLTREEEGEVEVETVAAGSGEGVVVASRPK